MSRKIIMFILIVIFTASFAGVAYAKKTCAVNDRVRMMWKGKWYDGTVIKVSGGKCLVNPNGFENRFDQWRRPRDLRFEKSRYGVGDTVYVRWKDSWWIAEVRNVKGDRWKIHYKGHSDLWDEWVGPDRIREYTNTYLVPKVNAP